MFTGIVEELGKISLITNSSLKVSCRKILDGTSIGDSISVNGICLTVTEIENESISFGLSPETVQRTSLKLLKRGDWVNLERALKFDGRLGGHILLGHVDTVTKISGIKREKRSFIFTFKIPPRYNHLLIEKGSIGIEGISLTVARILPDSFSVYIIPHTFENTNLKFKKVGNFVNLEFDVIGKYVERILKERRHL